MAASLDGCRNSQPPVAQKPEAPTRPISFHGQPGLETGPESAGPAGVTTSTVEFQDLHPTVQPTGQVAATDSDAVQVTSRLPGKVVDASAVVGVQPGRDQTPNTPAVTVIMQCDAGYLAGSILGLQPARITRWATAAIGNQVLVVDSNGKARRTLGTYLPPAGSVGAPPLIATLVVL